MRVAHKQAEQESTLSTMRLRDAWEEYEGAAGIIQSMLVNLLKTDDPALTGFLEQKATFFTNLFRAMDDDFATTTKHMRALHSELSLIHTEIAALQGAVGVTGVAKGSTSQAENGETPSGQAHAS